MDRTRTCRSVAAVTTVVVIASCWVFFSTFCTDLTRAIRIPNPTHTVRSIRSRGIHVDVLTPRPSNRSCLMMRKTRYDARLVVLAIFSVISQCKSVSNFDGLGYEACLDYWSHDNYRAPIWIPSCLVLVSHATHQLISGARCRRFGFRSLLLPRHDTCVRFSDSHPSRCYRVFLRSRTFCRGRLWEVKHYVAQHSSRLCVPLRYPTQT